MCTSLLHSKSPCRVNVTKKNGWSYRCNEYKVGRELPCALKKKKKLEIFASAQYTSRTLSIERQIRIFIWNSATRFGVQRDPFFRHTFFWKWRAYWMKGKRNRSSVKDPIWAPSFAWPVACSRPFSCTSFLKAHGEVPFQLYTHCGSLVWDVAEVTCDFLSYIWKKNVNQLVWYFSWKLGLIT